MSQLSKPISSTLMLRDHEPAGSARASLPTSLFVQAGKKPARSPGSAVLSEQAWSRVVGRLRLSRREGEIAHRVFDDKTEYAIADELGISPHTVHTHFERLYHKLGVADRVQLILCVMQEFLRLPASPTSQPPTIRAGAPRPAAGHLPGSATRGVPIRSVGRGVP